MYAGTLYIHIYVCTLYSKYTLYIYHICMCVPTHGAAKFYRYYKIMMSLGRTSQKLIIFKIHFCCDRLKQTACVSDHEAISSVIRNIPPPCPLNVQKFAPKKKIGQFKNKIMS